MRITVYWTPMYRSVRREICLITGLVACVFVSSLWANEIDFGREIRPILSENCYHCHGPDAENRKADLRLDTEEGAKRDLGGYAAVAENLPEESALVSRIETADSDEMMPPPDSGKELTKEQIAKLREWIAAGGKYEAHWAFRPIADAEAPQVKDETLSDIDRFLAAKLEKKGLHFSVPASKAQLIRRATFDLTGLPPKWEDVQSFLQDDSPDAFAKVVDRLLESPAYGERWGRHWLDVARYADTHGGSAIGFVRFPFSYTYRDYVIGAFNEDVPYDRFLLEQLAADQLGLEENDPARAALGFLTVGQQFRNRHDKLDDQIDVITRGLMGLTVSCARCHDHKFDPIPTKDYYALHATLDASEMPEELPLVGEPEIPEVYADALESREKARDDIVREQGGVMKDRLRMQVGLYLRELAKGTPEQDLSTAFLSFRTDDLRPTVLERWRDYLAEVDENDPVFGPWHRLSKLAKDTFAREWEPAIQALVKENGDPAAFKDEHRIATNAPKWNPRVLEAILGKKPASMVDVADAYGKLFADTHRKWRIAQLEAAEEAVSPDAVVPDQDPRHKIINSAIERQLRRHLYADNTPTNLPFDTSKNLRLLNRGVRDTAGGTIRAIDHLNLQSYAPPRSMELLESEAPDNAFVFVRGNPLSRGEAVQAHFLSTISQEDPPAFEVGHRRLGLAEAIVDPANPLTRRVIVNWVWQHHFGRGLVRTSDDFGTRGTPPTHPELLDYLASCLLEDGWSLKKLHRRLMLTAAYQQGSLEKPELRKIDPDNELLWRMPPRRLEMEAMRDGMLFVSGELDRTMGGKPFTDTDEKPVVRRTVYRFINRDIVPPLMSTFDGANPASCTVKRPETVVPQQTLFALNSNFIQGRAKALVALPEIANAGSNEERVRMIYHRLYSREPEAEEIELALNYIASEPEKPWARFAHVLLAANEFHFVD